MIRLHYLQHVPFEGPARLKDWAIGKGMSVHGTLVSESPLPKLDDFDWLLVMGGPMGVYDEAQLTWLSAEKAMIKEAIDAGKVVIGICLGAQLIAASMGARVYPNAQKEIGWMDVYATDEGQTRLNLPEVFRVFQWHGDTFDLPEGADLLATSPIAEHQAFIYEERVLALQFHLESSQESVISICEHCASEVNPGPTIQGIPEMTSDAASLSASNATMTRLMDWLYLKHA